MYSDLDGVVIKVFMSYLLPPLFLLQLVPLSNEQQYLVAVSWQEIPYMYPISLESLQD